MIFALYQFLDALIGLYLFVIIINAIFSWLVAFNVVNTSNRLVYTVIDATYRLTEPALRPIRRVLPDLGGLDVSPVVLYFAVEYLGRGLLRTIFSALI